MIYFYESTEDLAKRGGGVLSDGNDRWYSDVTTTTGMDIADYIEATYKDSGVESQMEDEYRDERDDSSRLADRHGCWCKLTAPDITCGTKCRATYCLHTCALAAYYLRGRARFAVYNLRVRTQHIAHNAVYNTRYAAYMRTHDNTLRTGGHAVYM